MSGIITITPNPTIDKSSSVTAIAAEKKLKCSPPLFEPGGGGVNVARAIKKLNGDATAFFVAGGYSGKFLQELLHKEEIKCAVLEIQDHTRENLIILDESTNLQYRFGMPGPFVTEEECNKLLKKIENVKNPDFIIASGSLSPGMPMDFFARVAFIAKKKKAKFIVDTSGEPLRLAIDEGVFLIKPSLSELSTLAGMKVSVKEMISDLARGVIDKSCCETILVSLGADGAVLVTKDNTLKITPPMVNIKSTVGAGDSMVAGMILKLSLGNQLFEAARYGVACGTAATLNMGTTLCKIEDVDRLFEFISEEELLV